MSDSSKKKYADNYRKPPKAFQFQKGKSGNPKGRPKMKRVDFDPGGDRCKPSTMKSWSSLSMASAKRKATWKCASGSCSPVQSTGILLLQD